MHRFLRAAGFSMYQKKKDIRALLRCLAREAGTSSCLQLDRGDELYEIKKLRRGSAWRCMGS